MRGLLVSVFRSRSDCTIGGITSRVNELTATWDGCERTAGVFDPSRSAPEVRIVERQVCGRPYLTAYVVDPETGEPVKGSCCWGGNFIYCCDSRFPSDYPVPVHDRVADCRARTEQLTARALGAGQEVTS